MSTPPPPPKSRSPVISSLRKSFTRFVRAYDLRPRARPTTSTSPSSEFLHPPRTAPRRPSTEDTALPHRIHSFSAPVSPAHLRNPAEATQVPIQEPHPFDSNSIDSVDDRPPSPHPPHPAAPPASARDALRTPLTSQDNPPPPNLSGVTPPPPHEPHSFSPSAPPGPIPSPRRQSYPAHSTAQPTANHLPPQRPLNHAQHSTMNFRNVTAGLSLGIHELTNPNKFKGHRGMPVDSFLADVINFVLAQNTPPADFESACVIVALNRCDRDDVDVRRCIDEFQALVPERQTWDKLRTTLKKHFPAESSAAAVNFAALLQFRLGNNFHKTPVMHFVAQCKVLLTTWARSDTTTEWARPCLTAATEDLHAKFLIVGKLLAEVPRDQMERVHAKLKNADLDNIHTVFSDAMLGKSPADQSTSSAPSYAMSSQNGVGGPPPVTPRSNPPQRFSNPPKPMPRFSQQHQAFNAPTHNPRPRYPNTLNRSRGAGNQPFTNQYRRPAPTRPRGPNPRRNFGSSLPANPHWQIPDNVCWLCLHPGHVASGCPNRPWCPYHESNTHGFADCAQFQEYSQDAIRKLYNRNPRHQGSFLASAHPQYHMEEWPNHPSNTATTQNEYIEFVNAHLHT